MGANIGGPATRRQLSQAMTSLSSAVQLATKASAAGSTFYVNAANSSAATTNPGTDPRYPLTTVASAIAKCTASRGDMIIVGPGHTENITGAAAIAVNKAGISIVGQGNGRLRPKFTWTTSTAAQITVTAAHCRWSNCVFDLTGVDAVVAGFSVTAAGFEFDNNEVIVANASGQAVLAILTDANADRLNIHDCKFWGTADAGCTSVISLVGGDGIIIRDNDINVACTTSAGVIANATTDSTNMIIHNNRLVNRTASSTKAIVLTATSTGFITNNRILILSGTAPLTAAAMYCSGNAYTATAGVTAGTASTF